MKPIIVNEITAEVRGQRILGPISLAAELGECVIVSGHNGSGKSTLLRVIAGEMPTCAGEVIIGGVPILPTIPRHRLRQFGLSFVGQRSNVFLGLTLQENLQLAARQVHFGGNPQFDNFAAQIVEPLSNFRNTKAGMLSGGQRQLLAVAMGLLGRPMLLLIDEPSVGLSSQHANSLHLCFKKILRETSTCIIITEQQVEWAMQFGTRQICIADGRLCKS